MADIAGSVAGLAICPEVVTPAADTQMLERVMANLTGIPSAERYAGDDSLWIAFGQMGAQGFLGDLITLTEDDIMNLQAQPARAVAHPLPIPIMQKRKTVIVVAVCQHCARLRGASVDMRLFPVELFDHFCISVCRHDEKIIPWQVELPSQVNAKASFLKSIKPNSKEHKVLRDDKSWLTFREATETTIMSHNLLTMIIPPFATDPDTGEFMHDPVTSTLIPCTPDDPGLDEIQRTWFCKALVDICQTPVGKKIVNQNCESMDTRMVWHELCEHYQNSMSSKMRSRELLRHAHSAQLVDSNHHGTHQSWITNFAETLRQCQALQTDENKLSDQTCVDFLNSSMRGTTHLEGLLDAYCAARKAAGIPDPFNVTLEECVERLIQAAQPHDASLGQSRGRGGRSANFHSILGGESDEEDNFDDEEDPQAAPEVCKSDWDQKSNGRKDRKKDNRFYKKPGAPTEQCAMIPRSKWNTFSRKDQIAWSKISEQAKKAMLNVPDNEKGSNSNPIAIVNNHEMIFEDEGEEEDTMGNGNPSVSAQIHSSSNRSIAANMHQSGSTRRTIQANASTLRDTSESKHQEPEERGLLCMATHKMSSSNRQIDTNSAFSKAIEKKSTSCVSWDNNVEQPASERYKKPQIEVNMARRNKVEVLEDGTLAGLESSDKEE